ncbi:hypothetical protein [Rariglobus hedericola]|uniref:Uncharacterized protein n=1 Tax=Rariglobus hedericola TaxID=2597822 RepID=A0A556QJH9_9BACT|nr:hypothetical protein [Rariglobus hedericola]TSJ76789.1 hypothetical protein FPL22_11745 [Rariglobus hedericola]
MTPLKPTRGFALLITITLLAFLVLLLVSLASLTRVETEVAGNGQKLAGARANALMALNLALGQLQKFAGPDQVVSARADITTSGSLLQPYLTGLWKTTNATSTPDVWLVSGNETSPVTKTPANVLDPATGTEPVVDGASGYVFLVGSNSVSVPAQRVRLEKKPVIAPAGSVPGLAAATTIGNYAWWIGDEGIKASASLVNPLLAANPIAYDNATGSSGQGDNWTTEPLKRARLDQMQLTRPRLEQIFPTLDPDTSGLIPLSKLRNSSQLLLMPNPPVAVDLKARFHDITPLSRAVLADLTAGRLKKDLSDITASLNPAVLKFQQARFTLAGAPSGVYDAYYTPVAAADPTATTYPAYSLGPVLTEVGVRLNFYLNSTDNKVHYAYVIDAELWNPYSAHLRLSAAAPLTLEISGLPTFTVRTDGLTDTSLTLPTLTASFDPSLTSDPANPWREGRIRVFRGTGSLPQVSPVTTPPATITIFDDVVPGAPVDPAATIVTLNYVASTSFTAVLKVNGDILSAYAPHLLSGAPLQYNAGSTTNSGGPAPGPAGYIVGYGYEFADSITAFTGDVTNPNYASGDPRLPSMKTMFYNNGSAPWNAGNPRNNTSGIGTANTFSTGGIYVHYDLPRQEITSVAMLTHVIGAKSYGTGNIWGGAANTVFDQYHVSTVPRFATTWTPENGLPLPNRYAEIYHPENTPVIPLADLRASANSARYFLQKGAFNINSTSIEAWRAVLGSKFAAWKYSGSTATGVALDNVFFRLPHGAQQITKPPLITGGIANLTARNQNPSQTGGRQLTSQEVTDLATQIVAQIRAHGRPYVSLAEFVNDGVIDKAIAAVPSINAVVPGIFTVGRRFTPGALIQSDVIGAIAPFMTARSDTFVIRTYGDAQNPITAAVDGRAWCEAVVQRLPDLAENVSAPIADVIAPSTATYPFGRKFKIISFRWLSASDI